MATNWPNWQSGSGSSSNLLDYKGKYDASTNTPTLTNGVGTKGDFYLVSVGGSNNPTGNNITQGNGIAYNGTIWEDVGPLNNNDTDNIILSNNYAPILNSLPESGDSVTDVVGKLQGQLLFKPIKVYSNINVNTLDMVIDKPISYLGMADAILNFINGGTLVNPPSFNGSSTTAGLNAGDVYTFTKQSDNTIIVS